jgi:hypothetical protein
MGDACAGCEQAVIRDHREGELEAFVGLPESVGRARRGTLLVRLVEHDVDHNLKAHSSPTSSYKNNFKKLKGIRRKKLKTVWKQLSWAGKALETVNCCAFLKRRLIGAS